MVGLMDLSLFLAIGRERWKG
uniref:Uncharacterized protein n=1 Tax=Arundo donax TaxID=35708 RepID=A0A0A9HPB1_ARUDO